MNAPNDDKSGGKAFPLDATSAIHALDGLAGNPTAGLPENLFLFVSRVTPMVNVDLLIRNERRETLLTWRDDAFHGPGWHIPGGIIRYKEKFRDRIAAVAKQELGAEITYDPSPLMISEIILPERRNRAHFISILFSCHLVSGPDDRLACTQQAPKTGEWKWHLRCPEDLIDVHRRYVTFFVQPSASRS
ncbi:MAG: NUDIX domain-containing protein [Candidatus Velamenicoccus archaeovorus]